jgi:uncharacterized repeat protein (TIGR03803 family)
VFGKDGNLYGTTFNGGSGSDGGVVFKVTPSGKETVLYSFCSLQNCTDGYEPFSGVLFDQKGTLYGTTTGGGIWNDNYCSAGCGVVFKITPSGKETVLYTFCSIQNCKDGAGPGPVILDAKGNLYGATGGGGSVCRDEHCGYGTVFKVTPSGKETVLYSFCSRRRCRDGASPVAGLIFDAEGNLYGTTYSGGAHGSGTVFKVTPSGKETVLHSFCSQSDCADGNEPYAGLIFDKKGNLYGTTYRGGDNGLGTVYKVTPSGTESVLYSFCSQREGGDCLDGAGPYAGLVFDKKDNLYGTTLFGGHNTYSSWGTVFELTPSGEETVLYTFELPDGATPYAGLVFDDKGNLYGTTYEGGYHYGTVFKLTP